MSSQQLLNHLASFKPNWRLSFLSSLSNSWQCLPFGGQRICHFLKGNKVSVVLFLVSWLPSQWLSSLSILLPWPRKLFCLKCFLLCAAALSSIQNVFKIGEIRTWILDANFFYFQVGKSSLCACIALTVSLENTTDNTKLTRLSMAAARVWLHKPQRLVWMPGPMISCSQAFSSTILKLIAKSNSSSNYPLKAQLLLLNTAKFSPIFHFSFVQIH